MCGCVCMYDNCVNVRTYLGVSRLNNELICNEYTLKIGKQQVEYLSSLKITTQIVIHGFVLNETTVCIILAHSSIVLSL